MIQCAHVVCVFLQFIAPAGFLIGAVVSYFRRCRSKVLFAKVRNAELEVDAVSWERFESLVAEGLRHHGFRVAEREGRAPDGGIDLEVFDERGRFLVQCKQWCIRQVGVTIVREFYGVTTADKAAVGCVVTSGEFTKEATLFADANGIQLLDGPGRRFTSVPSFLGPDG